MSQATVKTLARDPKKARYALINIARNDLGLDEDTYRGLLHSVTGKSSLRTMTVRELDQVIDRMKADGFKPISKPKSPPRRAGARTLADDRQSRKMRALWISGFHLGVIRDPSEAALVAFAKRLTGADALQWTVSEGANDVIEALKDMLEREAGVIWQVGDRRAVVGNNREDLVAEDRFWIVRAQQRIIRNAGIYDNQQWTEVCWHLLSTPPRLGDYQDRDWHQLIERLGGLIRYAKDNVR
jgi:phage gp16-like protein